MKNKYRLSNDGNCYEIFFRDGSFFIIDKEDLSLVSQYTWAKSKRGYPVYHTSRKSAEGVKLRPLHRLLMNPEESQDVDHISGNKMDNRRCNLRICTHQQNMFNQNLRRTNSTGCIGVSKHVCGRFEAYVNRDGHKYYLGLYGSIEEASKARDNAAEKLHGEYARLNMRQEAQ